jgi:hypothetical protein
MDFYRVHKGRVDLVDVPELLIVAVDGEGDPYEPSFAEAIQTLYPVSYGAHFILKKRLGAAPRVMPLEALWWVADSADQDTFTAVATGATSTENIDRQLWRWRALIVQPEPIDEAILTEAIEGVRGKASAALGRLRVERWHEGLCAQLLHLGPYSAEAPSIIRLHDGIEALGYRPRGRHHEIYLGDPRRSAPDQLRTILRHPVEPEGPAEPRTFAEE